ncbi:hypothetical protein E5288_WYG012405 [Bos mutus]|uniref:Uncharacterized protein n=1 Tax=Bos mutus TaxID=72004 RepID=A0A6B0RWB9_9CETA|nr:hypothetical protein [Bos mutus]
MTEDKVWTIVSHDLQMQTTVVGYNPEKYSVTQLIYSASMDQISAITSSAEYCEQYVSYFCKMSRNKLDLEAQCKQCEIVKT